MYNNDNNTPDSGKINCNLDVLADVINLDSIVVQNDSVAPAEPAKGPEQAKKEEPAKKEGEKKALCFKVESARNIQQTEEPRKKFLIDGTVTPGLNLLAGPRKIGKSWFALDMALCIAGKENFLGRETEHGKVLYFALEDTRARIKDRIDTQLDDDDAPDNLLVSYSTGYVGNEFYKDLDTFLTENNDTKLVIVDVMQKVRTSKDSGQTEYAHDYKDVGELKKVADKHGISILVITHTRKTLDTKNKLNNISGGVGVTGASDNILMIMNGNRSEDDQSKETELFITGRDIPDTELMLQFDSDNCRWKSIGTKKEVTTNRAEKMYASSPIVQTVKSLMAKNGGTWKGTCAELLDSGLSEIGCPISKSESALARKLNKFDELFENDNIKHIRPDPNGGTTGRNHLFVTINAPAK